MLAVNGYYDGNVCVLEEEVAERPQKVIITFLNQPFENVEKDVGSKITEEEKLRVLEEVQGLWKNHDNSVSVDDYVRNMRRRRQFDI